MVDAPQWRSDGVKGGEPPLHGGITFFRGTGASATAYLESDHYRADEYYLEEDGQLAQRFIYGPNGQLHITDALDAEHYQQWVDWIDPDTGEVRGKPKGQARLRQSDGVVRDLPASPRFAEMTVNCDKSLSVAAALSPEVSAALDAAQNEAAQAMSEYVASNAVTRVGKRGEQRLVNVERLESAAIVHKTSRAGDPHRHIHLQWNTRVFAEGQWRGLWTTPTLKQQAALRGIGESTIRSHAGLQEALTRAGFTFDPETGKVVELEKQAELLSKRHNQVAANVQEFETAWRLEHPGQEPSAKDRRHFDFQAWAKDRPNKQAKDHEVSQTGWITELEHAGLQVDGFTGGRTAAAATIDQLDTEAIVSEAVAMCESKASAWSLHDLQAAVAEQLTTSGVIADREQINTFITAAALKGRDGVLSISDPRDGFMPDHVKHITSQRVIDVETELKQRLTIRAAATDGFTPTGEAFASTSLEEAQARAAEIVTSQCALGVIEGAAGSGKTTLLREAKTLLDQQERQLVVLSPTLKGAQEASRSLDAPAFSVHKLLHANGFRWDEHGRYTRLSPGQEDPVTGKTYDGPKADYRLGRGARVVVDEAGMLDQDTALALVQLTDQHGAGLVFMGDRAQLPAVGRGGVLDHAVKISLVSVDVDTVHRFTDPAYAELSIKLRTKETPALLFNELYDSGHIRIHATQEEAISAMVTDGIRTLDTGGTVALSTPTNEVAREINAAMQDHLAEIGRTREPAHQVRDSDGFTLRHGDKIMTRHNDSLLGVANRETYTVKSTHKDGSITVTQGKDQDGIRLPQDYVTEHVHLGYASTEYGVQGATETTGAGLLSPSSSAAGTYVAATRGKEANTLHLVASSTDAARTQFVDVMAKDDADRGIQAAKENLAKEIEGLDLSSPPIPASIPQNINQTPPMPEAPPTTPTAPLVSGFDVQLREERTSAEMRKYQRLSEEFERRRSAFISKHGVTPEEWGKERAQAKEKHQAAVERLEIVRDNVQDTAEHRFRTAYVRDVNELNQVREKADSAGMFSKRQTKAELDTALNTFEARYDYRPNASISPEPSIRRIQQVRREALSSQSPEVAKAESIEAQTRAKYETMKDIDPKTLHESKRPLAPSVGTPDQEVAKDKAFAGRRAQNQRLKAQDRTASPTPSQQNTRSGPTR